MTMLKLLLLIPVYAKETGHLAMTGKTKCVGQVKIFEIHKTFFRTSKILTVLCHLCDNDMDECRS